jgi:haloalkane dehalogenase
MVLQNNYFIEEILPNAIMRKLSNEETGSIDGRSPSPARGDGRR